MRAAFVEAFQNAPQGTQTRIADDLGVRVQTVNKWAKGYNLPSREHIPRIEQMLGLKKGALMPKRPGVVSVRPPAQVDDDKLDQVLQMLMKVNDRLGAVLEKLEGPEPDPAAPTGRPARTIRPTPSR